jgi:hypothetical protein
MPKNHSGFDGMLYLIFLNVGGVRKNIEDKK